MRMMVTATIPHARFNAAVRDGSAGKTLGRILEEIKPEAVYFTDHHGERSAVMVVNLADASAIPSIAEPWFLAFEAKVEFKVVMTPEDLRKSSLDAIGKKWG